MKHQPTGKINYIMLKYFLFKYFLQTIEGEIILTEQKQM